jgi:hypothetical protein
VRSAWSARQGVLIALLGALLGHPFAPASLASPVPLDNPIAARYGASAYPWTEDIRWSNVKSVWDFPGADDMERYVAARDAAAAEGGGVVYFPPGDYTFTEDLYLTDGVVIRGAPPSGVATDEAYRPPTRLHFPRYAPTFDGGGTPNETAFKMISTMNPDRDSNVGVVDLDVDRAGIKLLGNADTGTNRNVLVYGVRGNNVAEPDPGVPDPTFQEGWQRWSYRFAANVKIQAEANVLVANSRLNDAPTDTYEQPGYRIRDGERTLTLDDSSRAKFGVTDHYGILVNRTRGNYAWAATPDSEPSLFRPGIVVRDNWVFHTMRVAIFAAGAGLTVQDNVIRDRREKVAWVDPTGTRSIITATTLENRAIDWSGSDVVVAGNDYQVYQHRIRDTPHMSVDGEGILIQECCGGSLVNGVSIRNNRGNAYIGLYRVRDIRNASITGNGILTSEPYQQRYAPVIHVEADTDTAPYRADDVRIEGNVVNGEIFVRASNGGTRNTIRDNRAVAPSFITISCALRVDLAENHGLSVQSLLPCPPISTRPGVRPTATPADHDRPRA